jgi:Protein of unknown function (DUF4242)
MCGAGRRPSLEDRIPSRKEQGVDTYVILRREGWRTADDLREAAARSTAAGERMPDDIAWIRSYVTAEADGSVGTVCIYQASSPEAIRAHARSADLPVDEIIPVADTVVVRPDPVPVAA